MATTQQARIQIVARCGAAACL